jgi:hypothetical protein
MTDRNLGPPGLFIPGATPERAVEIQRAVLLPVGTLMFGVESDALYEQAGEFTVIQIPTGAVLFRLARDAHSNLHFIHASPGTGTRIATVALPSREAGGKCLITMTWDSSGITLHAGYRGAAPVSAKGVQSATRLRVTNAGLIELGDDGVDVMGYQVFHAGQPVVRETALEAWESTLTAIDVHMRSTPAEGYLGEVVRANLALVVLATGFETYCGRRFRELPSEGRAADVSQFAAEFIPAAQRTAELPDSILAVLERRKIDFGNYDQCKRAFKSAFGLGFGTDLNVSPQSLADLKRMLEYRHRIVHVSAIEGLLNLPQVPPADPVFSNAQLVQTLVGAADGFVRALHTTTLGLP